MIVEGITSTGLAHSRATRAETLSDSDELSALTSALDSTELYDPTTKTFSPGPTLNEPHSAHFDVVLDNGQGIVLGLVEKFF